MFSSCFDHNTVQEAPTGPKVGLAYRESTPLRSFAGWDFLISDHILFSSCFAHNSVQEAPTGPKVGLSYRENIPLAAFSGLDFLIWDHISCSHLVLPITLSRKLPQAPKLACLIEKTSP